MNAAELDLMQRELDGENSPEESRRLQSLLAENGEARQLYDELSAVDSHLRQAEMVEPPAWLKRSIMDSLPARRTDRPGLADFLRGLWETMQARPALAYAYTFVVGLAVGLALFAIALEGPSQDGVVGTLVDAGAMEDLETRSSTPIELPGFTAQVELMTSRELLVVDVSADAQEQVEVRVVPEPAVSLRGFTRRGGTAPIDIQDDAVRFGVQGSNRYSLLFERADGVVIRLEVRRDGRLLYEERLRAEER